MSADHKSSSIIGKAGNDWFSRLAVSLIKSYLDNWVQCVYYNNCFSQPKLVPNGIPQGSILLILGPLLFILYINELPSNVVIWIAS